MNNNNTFVQGDNIAKNCYIIDHIEKNKDALIDISVCVMIWTRPQTQKEQFEVLKEARPSRIFLVSDGGRNEDEWKKIEENRKLFDHIDWNCEVVKVFLSQNHGMYAVSRMKSEIIWSMVDYCVFFEDDQIPSVSYLKFCKELLEKYKNDLRVAAICGFNYMNDCSNDIKADYFFANRYAIWGGAFWKRTYEAFSENLPNINDEYTWGKIVESTKKNGYSPDFLKRIKGYYSNEYYEGHVAAQEFYYYVANCVNRQVFIIPTRNMICNAGATSSASHGSELKLLPKTIQRLFNSRTYEIGDEINHPDNMIVYGKFDKNFAKNLLSGYWYYDLYRKLVRGIRVLLWGDYKDIRKKLVKSKEN